MMDDKEVSVSSEEKDCNVHPMYFGVSCAFVALQLLSKSNGPELDDDRWSAIRDRMLQGSAQLLGLLLWKAQQGKETIERKFELKNKLEKAETEVSELKRRRIEDAKANQKVASIYATQEQSWLSERKTLRQHIQSLFNELRVLERNKGEIISNLNDVVEEKERLIQSKDKALEETERRKKELEEKLRNEEAIVEELRVAAKREGQEHSSELWKHKTAFIELVSNQRQLEAEMGRALRQVEAAKQELDSVYEQKEESIAMVRKLSVEVVKMQKDGEQKDKILSAMLRKSKLDTAEKQMLLKDVKISKARRKQAELEMERLKTVCESRNGKNSRSVLIDAIEAEGSRIRRVESQQSRTLLLEYLEDEQRKEKDGVTPKSMKKADFHQSSLAGNGELVLKTDVKELESWVQLETEKYTAILGQRHQSEIEAFAEQMRLKDEKLEAFRWRLLSMELESKRLQSHIEGLNESLSQFREENIRLEALLLDRDKELKYLQEKFNLDVEHFQKSAKAPALEPDAVWSEVKIIKRKLKEKDQQKASLFRVSKDVEREDQKVIMEEKLVQMALEYKKEQRKDKDMNGIDTIVRIDEQFVEEIERSENPVENQSQNMRSTVQDPVVEIEEEKEVIVDPGHVCEEDLQKNYHDEGAVVINKIESAGQCLIRKDSLWKMDLHALGVSYKIKRLEQQLLMLEKLTGAEPQDVKKPNSKDISIHVPESSENRKINERGERIKGFLLLMSFLNKQVKRYQSLEEKTNNLCKRLHENDHYGSSKDSSNGKSKEQTKTLEQFLEETFQLQRYMVATGQKLMEIQSRITFSLVGIAEGLDEASGFNIRQFADNVRTLFREIQRGLEVRIARIIGDLEGTLACEGILHLRK